MASNEFFPSIRSLAEQADALPEDEESKALVDDEEQPLQEIESLCMKCGEQV